MREENVPEVVKKSYEKLPHFPDGRIDYREAKINPTVVVFVKYQNEILLLKRSDKVMTHKNKWGLVAGYLDELKPIVEKGIEEVNEETGIRKNEISSVVKGNFYKFSDGGRKYISFPVLVELRRKPEIRISWEHTDFEWVDTDKLDQRLSSNAMRELSILLSM